jgi:Tfp pilus assembly protein PilZ
MTGREIRESWEDTRLFRMWQWSELYEAVPMMKPLTQDQRSRYEEVRDSLKVKFQPVAVNICGGGIRLKLPENYSPGDRIAMQFFLPFAKPNTIDVVAEVVWTTPVIASTKTKQMNYVGMTYYFIDERDRENIIRFISLEQLQQLQQQRGKLSMPLPDESYPTPDELKKLLRKRIINALIALLIISAIAVWLGPILYDYYSGKSDRNEIEQNFESSVNQYKKGSGTNGAQ